jgi:hypothetical protein
MPLPYSRISFISQICPALPVCRGWGPDESSCICQEPVGKPVPRPRKPWAQAGILFPTREEWGLGSDAFALSTFKAANRSPLRGTCKDRLQQKLKTRSLNCQGSTNFMALCGLSHIPRNTCFKNSEIRSQMWWHTPVLPALRRLRQEDCSFQGSYRFGIG